MKSFTRFPWGGRAFSAGTDFNPEATHPRSVSINPPVWLSGIRFGVISGGEPGEAVCIRLNPPFDAPDMPIRGSSVNRRTAV
ncbi:hypothetical protein SAMN05443247_01171 [Bradyrhizobium erythrophlei]|nr:hypothetical protein SAMN05443247_01171 [Bradyrhizobium erythrophlei]